MPKREHEGRQLILLGAIVAGKARWEPFAGSGSTGEVCIGGTRHWTLLDADGCPEVSNFLAAELGRAMSERKEA